MTATEKLRQLLDERGGRWMFAFKTEQKTIWSNADGVTATATNWGDGLLVKAVMTPEQAIAATLGLEECHVTVQDNLAETEGMGDVWLECDACRWQMLLEPSTPRFNYCPNCGRRVMDE